MVLAPNTSVRLRTLSEQDVTTALFDVDHSIQCALSYGLLEPWRTSRAFKNWRLREDETLTSFED